MGKRLHNHASVVQWLGFLARNKEMSVRFVLEAPCLHGEMEITTPYEGVVGGSNPSGDTNLGGKMIGNRRNRGRYCQQECRYGCCRDNLPKATLRRILRTRENRAWKKDAE